MSNKINICVALAGTVTRRGEERGMTPYVPITPDEMAEDAKRCYDAGASIVHIHARDPKTGLSYGPKEFRENTETFKEIVEKIQAKCPIIINITTGGHIEQTLEQKLAPVSEIKPEMASFTSGSFSYGMFSKRENRFVADFAVPTTFSDMLLYANEMREKNVKPECEIYNQAMLDNIKIMEHAFKPPIQFQFVMGIPGQVTSATPRNLIRLVDTANDTFESYTWSVCVAGINQWPIITLAAILGAQTIRVGLEDNIYLEPGVWGTNAQMVEKAVKLAQGVGREIASVEEARASLQLG